VRLSDGELEALEAEANSAMELKEFIPINKVDPVYFEHVYDLAPDEGGEKPYRLLADSMEKLDAQHSPKWFSTTKNNLFSFVQQSEG